MLLFFGIDFDPDEREDSVRKKIEYVRSFLLEGDKGFSDPYDALISHLNDEISTSKQIQKLGKIPVEYWLLSKPKIGDLVTVGNYAAFIDSNGCKEYATKVQNFVTNNIIPDIPVMLGVDHSCSGGAIGAISKELGAENLSFIILDSHFDAILPEVRCGLVQYDLETNPETKFRRSDPYIWDRPNSFNADSFIHYLIKDQIVYPENLIIIGAADNPPTRAQAIRDERVQRFVDSYMALQRQGTKIVTKENVNRHGIAKALASALAKMTTPYVYVSLDIDIGSISAHHGSRYLNVKGLNEKQIYLIAQFLNRNLYRRETKLTGFDVMETDVHTAGQKLSNGSIDKTYQIESKFMRLLFLKLV